MKYWAIYGLITALLFVGGCREEDQSDGRITVVTTIGMIADVAKEIGGEHVYVRGLMGPGVDPHLYRASEGDVRRLRRAQIVFYNGIHLESKMGDVLEKLSHSKTVVAVAHHIPKSKLIDSVDFENMHDPHVWFDVSIWQSVINPIRDTYIKMDPEHKSDYMKWAETYRQKLIKLDAYVRAETAKIPAAQRVLVTAHDAFQYFGRAYGIEVVGLQGISTNSEASTHDIKRLVDIIVSRKIPSIFVETSIPVRNIESVRRAAEARGWQVNIGGELYSDAMGDAGSHEGTYIGMIEHNVKVIVKNLNKNNKMTGEL